MTTAKAAQEARDIARRQKPDGFDVECPQQSIFGRAVGARDNRARFIRQQYCLIRAAKK